MPESITTPVFAYCLWVNDCDPQEEKKTGMDGGTTSLDQQVAMQNSDLIGNACKHLLY